MMQPLDGGPTSGFPFWRIIMDRTWSVEIEVKKHLIEVEYGRNGTRTDNTRK